jgi:hypothetical protein
MPEAALKTAALTIHTNLLFSRLKRFVQSARNLNSGALAGNLRANNYQISCFEIGAVRISARTCATTEP